jgi:hypothetical protein
MKMHTVRFTRDINVVGTCDGAGFVKRLLKGTTFEAILTTATYDRKNNPCEAANLDDGTVQYKQVPYSAFAFVEEGAA